MVFNNRQLQSAVSQFCGHYGVCFCLNDVVVHGVLCKIINDFHISCFVFNHTTQEDTVSHLSDNITNTQRLFTAGSDTGCIPCRSLGLVDERESTPCSGRRPGGGGVDAGPSRSQETWYRVLFSISPRSVIGDRSVTARCSLRPSLC